MTEIGCSVFTASSPNKSKRAWKWALASAALLSVNAASGEAVDDLSRMSLQELASVEVTSVLKSAEPLRRAPAAIYIITHDDIIRSGVTSLAEALRLAPNLQTTQLTSTSYTLGARGFGGNPDVQNFANKLLILIDGRSVYTPLFSGIYLDAQDVVMNDIERIEVISGPGATLWGANAMNGVINVITKAAYLTQGALVSVAAGTEEQNLSARYGNALDEDRTYRVYAKAFHRDAAELADGASARDSWDKAQGGFRFDWTGPADTLTVQGDAYRGTQSQPDRGDSSLVGANTLTRWQHRGERSELQLQAYYDRTERSEPPGGVAFVLDTFDFELQQSIFVGSHRLVWGAGERVNSYRITNSSALLFEPPKRSLTLANVFAQDTVSITQAAQLTLGAKLEDDPYSGWSFLPEARASWELGRTTLLWVAASQAIRSPTPFDEDVVEKVGQTVFLVGDKDFSPEHVTAYELGYRGQPASNLSVSISAFYNVYDDLRTIEPASSATFLPIHWANLMEGHTYGIEVWGHWQIASWWRLSPAVRTLHKDLRFKTGASGLLGVAQAGNDPKLQGSLSSSIDLGHATTFDASVRYVSPLPSPALQGYYEMNARFGWRTSKSLELSLSGYNLLHTRHKEYPAPAGEDLERSVLAEARWSW